MADGFNNIEKFSSNGTDLGDFATTTGEPYALAFDRSGNLYVSILGNNEIEEFSSSGADLGTFASTGLDLPYSIAFSSGISFPAAAVPEPSVFGLLGIGALLAGGYAWRKKQATNKLKT